MGFGFIVETLQENMHDLNAIFLFINYIMSLKFLEHDSWWGRSPSQLSHIEIESEKSSNCFSINLLAIPNFI